MTSSAKGALSAKSTLKGAASGVPSARQADEADGKQARLARALKANLARRKAGRPSPDSLS